MKIYKFVCTGKVGDHQSSIRAELKFVIIPTMKQNHQLRGINKLINISIAHGNLKLEDSKIIVGFIELLTSQGDLFFKCVVDQK